MRSTLFAATLLLTMLAGNAADRKYAVLSLVGDRFLVTGRSGVVNRPAREFVALPEPLIDATALAAVKEGLASAQPAASATLLLAREPALYAAAEAILDAGLGAGALYEAIEPALRVGDADLIVLVSKAREQARLRFHNVYFETDGRIEGVGFYVDSAKRVARLTDGQVSHGFLGVFAYIRISLIDPASRKVLAEELLLGSTTARDPDKTPWDSMSAEAKVRTLKALVHDEIVRAMPRLLRGR